MYIEIKYEIPIGYTITHVNKSSFWTSKFTISGNLIDCISFVTVKNYFFMETILKISITIFKKIQTPESWHNKACRPSHLSILELNKIKCRIPFTTSGLKSCCSYWIITGYDITIFNHKNELEHFQGLTISHNAIKTK